MACQCGWRGTPVYLRAEWPESRDSRGDGELGLPGVPQRVSGENVADSFQCLRVTGGVPRGGGLTNVPGGETHSSDTVTGGANGPRSIVRISTCTNEPGLESDSIERPEPASPGRVTNVAALWKSASLLRSLASPSWPDSWTT
jgi:hypothetical protein